MGDTTIISVSDVHGHLDETIELFEAAFEAEEIEPLFRYTDETTYRDVVWTGGRDYRLVFNGDMIGRGPQSREALEFVWGLQDSAQEQGYEDQVSFVIGNSEAYALHPEYTLDYFDEHDINALEWVRSDDETFYWWHMEEDIRDELRTRIVDEDIVAGLDGHNFQYLHAGQPDAIDTKKLNNTFRESVPGKNEKETEQYVKFLGKNDGTLWTTFDELQEGADHPQIVGHTPAKYVDESSRSHPHQYGAVINTDSITDCMRGDSDQYGLLVENPDEVYALVYDGEAVERKDFKVLQDEKI